MFNDKLSYVFSQTELVHVVWPIVSTKRFAKLFALRNIWFSIKFLTKVGVRYLLYDSDLFPFSFLYRTALIPWFSGHSLHLHVVFAFIRSWCCYSSENCFVKPRFKRNRWIILLWFCLLFVWYVLRISEKIVHDFWNMVVLTI